MVCLGNKQDHPVIFEIASKYCISDSLVDHDVRMGLVTRGAKFEQRGED